MGGGLVGLLTCSRGEKLASGGREEIKSEGREEIGLERMRDILIYISAGYNTTKKERSQESDQAGREGLISKRPR